MVLVVHQGQRDTTHRHPQTPSHKGTKSISNQLVLVYSPGFELYPRVCVPRAH